MPEKQNLGRKVWNKVFELLGEENDTVNKFLPNGLVMNNN